jgi:formylglycine-generating enzyme required for sulfatase activity
MDLCLAVRRSTPSLLIGLGLLATCLGGGRPCHSAPPLAKSPLSSGAAAELQKQWADFRRVPVKDTNSVGVPLVLIPPGEFEMGSTSEEVQWALDYAKLLKLRAADLEKCRNVDTSRHPVDWFSPNYYQQSAASNPDPTGPAAGSSRVLRGGSWHYFASLCRSTFRFYNTPGTRYHSFGFRVAVAVSR